MCDIQVFYAVDFGGINIRTIRCALDGRGKSKVKSLKYNIKESKLGTKFPKGLLDKNATASLLFDDIAAAVNQHVQREVRMKIVHRFISRSTSSLYVDELRSV